MDAQSYNGDAVYALCVFRGCPGAGRKALIGKHRK